MAAAAEEEAVADAPLSTEHEVRGRYSGSEAVDDPSGVDLLEDAVAV